MDGEGAEGKRRKKKKKLVCSARGATWGNILHEKEKFQTECDPHLSRLEAAVQVREAGGAHGGEAPAKLLRDGDGGHVYFVPDTRVRRCDARGEQCRFMCEKRIVNSIAIVVDA